MCYNVNINKEVSYEKLKTEISLIILGNLLYLSSTFFGGNETSSFGDFGSGLLIGFILLVSITFIVCMILQIAYRSDALEIGDYKKIF